MSAGALPPSAGPSRRLSASSPRAPTPALFPQRATLQGSRTPAGFCPHRRISRLASLKSRRLNLRTRPRTSLAAAAARGGSGAGRRERARPGAGLGRWKPGLELAGLREGAGRQGVGPQAGLAGTTVTGPGARGAAHCEEAGRRGPRGACWENEFQPRARHVRKRRPEAKLPRVPRAVSLRDWTDSTEHGLTYSSWPQLLTPRVYPASLVGRHCLRRQM